MLGVDPSTMQMTQKRLCRDVLGEDVSCVVVGVDLDQPHEVVKDQLLYKQVLELDMLCFL